MFRADLFYRLNVFPLEVPALRERRADIPLLVEYFIHRFSLRAGKNIRGVSKETATLLQAYDWPGNIRELQNLTWIVMPNLARLLDAGSMREPTRYTERIAVASGRILDDRGLNGLRSKGHEQETRSKVAVVTGASKGIGASIAKALAEEARQSS